MSAIPMNAAQRLGEQTRALIGLRWTVWLRRARSEGKWGRIVVGVLGLLFGLAISAFAAAGVYALADEMQSSPKALADAGGSLALLGILLSGLLGARLYLSVISVATGVPFLHPRRFLVYAVPPMLVTAINCLAQLFEPAWLVFYVPAACIAWFFSALPGAPGAGEMLLGLALLFLCGASLLQLIISMVAELFAHKATRRVASLGILALGWGTSLAFSHASNAPRALSPANLWGVARWTPPGWAVLFADALTHARWRGVLGYALALLATALGAALISHRLSLQEARRPAETTLAPASVAKGPAGWLLPFFSGPTSALIEKETKTLFRAMWLQMIAGPVGFLVMRFALMQGRTGHGGSPLLGSQPLLMGAVYAHLGVLNWSVNIFGVDGQATRGLFLWPLRGRTVLAAKNAVAYAVSLLIFLVLAALASVSAPLSAGQLLVGLCAHAATFPLLAALGNTASIYYPSPMKGGRVVRQPGGATAFVRIGALAVMALTAWAPYALAKLLGLPLIAAYLGELVVMGIAYGGLLSFSEKLLETRREKLLQALAKDD